ncbi:hypothetical protein KJ997_06045 [bacterium]|nr:hypothetical protein [bacterium]
MKKNLIIFPLIISLLLIISFTTISFTTAFCGLVETYEKGAIDWEKGIVAAEGWGFPPKNMHPGQARLMAERAAKVDAYRNLLEAVNAVRVDAQTTVKESVVESDVIRAEVQGFIKGAKISEPKYMSDGTVKVELTIALSGVGGLSGIFFPKPSLKIEKEKGEKTIPEETYLPSLQEEAKMPAIDFTKPFTGLVINAQGLEIRPAMNPKILSEKGQEIYGSASVSSDFAERFGMVGYAKDLEEACKIDRVKDNPLVIKALNFSGKQKTDVVISNNDAALLYKLNQNLSFLKECKVIFVLD